VHLTLGILRRDAPRFVIDGEDLLSWRARVGTIPGGSARGRWAAFRKERNMNYEIKKQRVGLHAHGIRFFLVVLDP
jgi:hypothetical protein